MEPIYKKMYAIVVGGADDTIQFLANHLLHGRSGPEICTQAAQMLKDALLKAEDLYLDAEDE